MVSRHCAINLLQGVSSCPSPLSRHPYERAATFFPSTNDPDVESKRLGVARQVTHLSDDFEIGRSNVFDNQLSLLVFGDKTLTEEDEWMVVGGRSGHLLRWKYDGREVSRSAKSIGGGREDAATPTKGGKRKDEATCLIVDQLSWMPGIGRVGET